MCKYNLYHYSLCAYWLKDHVTMALVENCAASLANADGNCTGQTQLTIVKKPGRCPKCLPPQTRVNQSG